MEELYSKINILRALSLISTTEAGSGHPTSCLSAADILGVIFDRYFSFDIKNPNDLRNDRIIMSKGHASPLLYSAFAISGAFERKDFLTLRKFGSNLEGHPTPRFVFAPVATGSLGQGLSVGAGMALMSKKLSIDNHTFVIMGDGEVAEGQIYEAVNFASFHKLDNLIGIIDVNRLGQTGPTMFDSAVPYENIFFAHGANTTVINGNNPFAVDKALEEAMAVKNGKPSIIIANTIKGAKISFLEGRENLHGKALSKDDLKKALVELKVDENIIEDNSVLFNLKDINARIVVDEKKTAAEPLIDYEIGEEVATREAFGKAFTNEGLTNNKVYAFDGDVSNSTYTDKFKEKIPERFIECFIAEQNMVSSALGIQVFDRIPLVSTFGAFLTRAFDQIRMAAISGANIKFNGSHVGVSIGEDGPSQMALEDIAMFASIPGSIILQPSDANSCLGLVHDLFSSEGIGYIRTMRGATKVIYENSKDFKIGGSRVLRSSDNDLLVVIATGICVHEALRAYDEMQSSNVNVCIIDTYSIKPLDIETIKKQLEKAQKKVVITVEDHYVNGGLGDIVASNLSKEKVEISKLAINEVPRSGRKEELLKNYKIDSSAIIEAVKNYI